MGFHQMQKLGQTRLGKTDLLAQSPLFSFTPRQRRQNRGDMLALPHAVGVTRSKHNALGFQEIEKSLPTRLEAIGTARIDVQLKPIE